MSDPGSVPSRSKANSVRWLITGASGMVGSEATTQLRKRGADVIAVGRPELDVTDRDAVLYLCKLVRPDLILNCAAYTNVDRCETDEEEAHRVNATAVEYLAEAANRFGALLAHISTDFVFDGGQDREWEINDDPAPLSAYGRTKLAGETAVSRAEKHLVVRTSWVFGANGWNFVEAILKQLEGGNRELRVVDDQRGRPTWTPHLVSALIDLGERGLSDEASRGVVHYADGPACTWYDFARAIVDEWCFLEEIDEQVAVKPVSSDAFPRPAIRPPNSVLSTHRYEEMTGNAPGEWRNGLAEYLRKRDLDYDAMS